MGVESAIIPTRDHGALKGLGDDDHPHYAYKEFFIPFVFGAEVTAYAAYSCANCDALNEEGDLSFFIPNDFIALVAASIVVIPRSTQAAAAWGIYSYYCAEGEAYNTHNESDAVSTYNVTDGQMFEVDISGIFSSLVANDFVGIRLKQLNAAHDVSILGVRFKYT